MEKTVKKLPPLPGQDPNDGKAITEKELDPEVETFEEPDQDGKTPE